MKPEEKKKKINHIRVLQFGMTGKYFFSSKIPVNHNNGADGMV